MTYGRFLREHARFLGFGLLLTLASSVGQTFFVSLFGAGIRSDLGLSHGGFGALYSLATLGSAASLVWVGGLIDRVDLRLYCGAACGLLVAACATMAIVTGNVTLVIGLFCLRLFGQGLMSHTATTSMGRYFDEGRGKAMAIAALGFAIGEGVLPTIGVRLIDAVGWRTAWLVVAGILALVLPAMSLWLLRGHADRHRAYLARKSGVAPAAPTAGASSAPGIAERDWTVREVLRDPRYYLVLVAVTAPGFLLTGFFFHQIHIDEEKGWTPAWFAMCFAYFAACKITASLVAGPLVDRFTAARLAPGVLVPLALGLAVMGLWSDAFAGLTFMVLAGLGIGAQVAIIGALWPELYGTLHLGQIRSVNTAIGVLGTALSPAAFGWLFDRHVSVEAIAWASAAYVVVATALITVGLRGLSRD